MPRYFFNIVLDGQVIEDTEGTVCNSIEDAKYEAKLDARDLASQAIKSNVPPDTMCVEITDTDGSTLASLTVGEVLKHPFMPEFGKGCPPESTQRSANHN